jgi:hypothetical protein
LGHGTFGTMLVEDLQIAPRVAQRLMKLARNPHLAKPTNWSSLPSTLSVLCSLEKLSQTDFEKAASTKAIHPKMTAKEAESLVRMSWQVDKPASTTPVQVRGWVTAPSTAPTKVNVRLSADIMELAAKAVALAEVDNLPTAVTSEMVAAAEAAATAWTNLAKLLLETQTKTGKVVSLH